MINKIISIFDEHLLTKCYIDKYGRFAITAKQAVTSQSGKPSYKRFPVACKVTEDCNTLADHLDDLMPDDSKKSVSFWLMKEPIRYDSIPNVSSARRMRKATALIEFVWWGHMRRLKDDNSAADWCSDPAMIIMDLVKLFECKGQPVQTGVDWISNLRMKVVRIGNVNTFRQAMREYSIDNIEALTVWPYTGFTLTVEASCIVNVACIPAYLCSDEVPCFDVPPVVDNGEGGDGDGEGDGGEGME